MLKGILYRKGINTAVRNLLKPFAQALPDRFKFPVNGTFTVKSKSLPEFNMLTNPTSAVTKYLFWGNVEGFEYNAVRIFADLCKDSKLFYDIGSNIGYYSLLASAITNKKIHAVAFEPMPSAYKYLLENIELNNFENIQAVQLALSNQKGSATFFAVQNLKFAQYDQLTGDGSLNGNPSAKSSRIEFEVKIDTLDNFVSMQSGDNKIDLIKLDTEANEDKVLSGAHKVLSEHRPIIQCEILKNQIEEKLETVLAPYNYIYFRATHQGLVRVSTFKNNPTGYHDHYLVPAEKENLVRKFII